MLAWETRKTQRNNPEEWESKQSKFNHSLLSAYKTSAHETKILQAFSVQNV